MKTRMLPLIVALVVAAAPAAHAGGLDGSKFVESDIDRVHTRKMAWQLAREFAEGEEARRAVTVDPRAPDALASLQVVIDAQSLRLDIFAEVVREQAHQGAVEAEVAAQILAEIESLIAELEAFSATLDELGQVGFELMDPFVFLERSLDPTGALDLWWQGVERFMEAVNQSPEEAAWDMEERTGLDWNHDGCKGSTDDGCEPFEENDEQVKRFPRSTTNIKRKNGIIMVDIPGDWWDLGAVAESFDPGLQIDDFGEALRVDGGAESLEFIGDMLLDVQMLNEIARSVR